MAKQPYTWRGDHYDSVTEIIGAGIPKPFLKAWGERLVAEFAFDEFDTLTTMRGNPETQTDDERDERRGRAVDWLKREPLRFTNDRANIGTLIHDVAEARSLGSATEPDVHDPIARKAVDAWEHWHRHYRVRYIAAEFTGYHRGYRYAGTADCLIEIDDDALPAGYAPGAWARRRTEAGRPEGTWTLLGDYKTSATGPWPDVGLQLNAYERFEFVGAVDGTEQPMPEVDGAVVIKLRPSFWSMTPVVLGDAYFAAFLYAREVMRWRRQLEKTVLLRPAEHTLTDADHMEVATSWQ